MSHLLGVKVGGLVLVSLALGVDFLFVLIKGFGLVSAGLRNLFIPGDRVWRQFLGNQFVQNWKLLGADFVSQVLTYLTSLLVVASSHGATNQRHGSTNQ